MKRTVITAMVLSLAVGSLALADPPQGQWQDQHHDQHHDQGEHRGRDEHRAPVRAHMVFNSGRYERPHGWRAHSWHRGDRLPPAYRAQAYVIPSPAAYRLRPPPAGYYWVRVDNNAVLAAVATGVVVDVAVNLFH
jgi:Ni/Co efflux regulator RcnB